MNDVIKYVGHEKGYNIGDKDLNIIRCAGDSVHIADGENNLQRLLHQFVLSCKKYRMKMSVSKTKALTVSKEPLQCQLEI
jgi:hypothetical protein